MRGTRGTRTQRVVVHSLVVRITHWVNAFAMVCMVMSGWAIYNASPLFPFRFPEWATVGGWLGGSIGVVGVLMSLVVMAATVLHDGLRTHRAWP